MVPTAWDGFITGESDDLWCVALCQGHFGNRLSRNEEGASRTGGGCQCLLFSIGGKMCVCVWSALNE